MLELTARMLGIRPQPHAVAPTLLFRLHLATRQPIGMLALRTLIRIEPRCRRHTPVEQGRLLEPYAEPRRWGETVRGFPWTEVAVLVPAFEATIEIDVPVGCSYDLDVLAAKYLSALGDGDVPLQLLFRGTAFLPGPTGLQVAPIDWSLETHATLPVATWRSLMDRYYARSTWIRLGREQRDALLRYRGETACMSWDAAIDALLRGARATEVS